MKLLLLLTSDPLSISGQIDANRFSLNSYENVIYEYFDSDWCAPCSRDLPSWDIDVTAVAIVEFINWRIFRVCLTLLFSIIMGIPICQTINWRLTMEQLRLNEDFRLILNSFDHHPSKFEHKRSLLYHRTMNGLSFYHHYHHNTRENTNSIWSCAQ